MKKFQHIIIGFGKGGKTLAATLAKAGQTVALIEKDPQMYGGTCINVGCIPSKYLERSARSSNILGGDYEDKAQRFTEAIEHKRQLTAMLRRNNYDKVVAAGVHVFTGTAAFNNQHEIAVAKTDGTTELLWAEKFYIDTGADSFIPPIPGLQTSKFFYTSTTLMEKESLPQKLVIIGGGYIGLEFASYFTNFGSQVTIIQDNAEFLPREDEEIAKAVLHNFAARKITLLRSTKTVLIKDEADHASLTLQNVEGEHILEADAILVATGRRPNVKGLNLSAAGVELTERGAVKTNEHLQTTADNIWAMGDVCGGLQFTYISLDDFRIVKSQILGDSSRTVNNRGTIPYTVFLDPPFSRVGLTEAEAIKQGYDIKIGKMLAAAIPKAHVFQKSAGVLKVVIDAKTDLILGAHFFCAESHEIINLIKLCIDNNIKYQVLRDGIFNHPTVSEALNDLFGTVR